MGTQDSRDGKDGQKRAVSPCVAQEDLPELVSKGPNGALAGLICAVGPRQRKTLETAGQSSM